MGDDRFADAVEGLDVIQKLRVVLPQRVLHREKL